MTNCPQSVPALPIPFAVHCLMATSAAGNEAQENSNRRRFGGRAFEQLRVDLSNHLVAHVIRASLSTRELGEEAIEDAVEEFYSSVGERKLGLISYSAPASRQQCGDKACCRFEGKGCVNIPKARVRVDVAPVNLELRIREGESNKVLRSRCTRPENCADDLLEVQQEVHADVRGTIVVPGDPQCVDRRISIVLTFGFRCEQCDRDAKKDEQSHATEPAAGPVSNGESSPPTR